jgi:hypothetical protein
MLSHHRELVSVCRIAAFAGKPSIVPVYSTVNLQASKRERRRSPVFSRRRWRFMYNARLFVEVRSVVYYSTGLLPLLFY